uniref:Spermidine/spermine N1-acetyltransferase family member 2b n=1 Tax=Nothobranchius furzeri TaxID=105023 RepID=A0A8C6LKY0_NOTFU
MFTFFCTSFCCPGISCCAIFRKNDDIHLHMCPFGNFSCVRLELQRDGFCQNPFFECLVAEIPEELKSKEGFTVVGYALYFYTYSTWKGRSLYLEDLYVMPEFRGINVIVVFAQVGRSKQCVRLQLSVLNWNTPSRDFYAAKGGQDLTVSEGWHFVRFDGQNLDNLANDAPKI